MGCDFFHLVEIEKGKVTRNEEFAYLSNESINHFGADKIFEDYSHIVGDDDWEVTYADELKIFAENGVKIEAFRELVN
jgi:hypothetical protein